MLFIWSFMIAEIFNTYNGFISNSNNLTGQAQTETSIFGAKVDQDAAFDFAAGLRRALRS